MGELKAITDDGAVFQGTKADREVVFGRGGSATNFEGSDVSIERMVSEIELVVDRGRIRITA